MFFDNPNVEKVADGVYIYRDFVDKKTLDNIHFIINAMEGTRQVKTEVKDHSIDWYHDKFTKPIPELYKVWAQMNELLMPEYCIHPCLTLLTTGPGEDMYHHSDSPGENMEDELVASDVWKTCCVIHYGAIVYFGEWEGGEVYYPNLDSTGKYVGNFAPFNGEYDLNEVKHEPDTHFRIKPKAGDLLIHGAHSENAHGVNTILSGRRYAYSNFVLPVEKNPGTFPVYGTKENEERLANNTWLEPIGYTWTPSEKLQKEIDAGVTGVRYRDK